MPTRFALSNRHLFLAIFLACAGLMAFGLYLQHALNLEPCPMCILQRYAYVATAVIALVAALHGAGRVGAALYGALIAIAAGMGGGVAGRQVWLQHHPTPALDCGPDLNSMLESFPLSQALPRIFKGEGDCAKVVWKFLGLSIPEWALFWFVLLAAAGLYLLLVRSRHRAAG
jgi:disulfide bond formation protein DsbB